MSIPSLIYTVRRNTPNLLPHEKAEAVREFETYKEAQKFISTAPNPGNYHITTDRI